MPKLTFDNIVWGVVGLLALAIGLTLLAGDRVGVRVERAFPLTEAHSTDVILMGFSEPMNRDSVSTRFVIEPFADGEFSWNNNTFVFRPTEPLSPGKSYQVSLLPGAESRSGRRVLDEYQFRFDVRNAWVAYLAPAVRSPQNVWMVNPNDLNSAQQVTFSEAGIFDFAASPDGRSIVFSDKRTDRAAADLKLLNLETGTIELLVNCNDADCNGAVWRPDGNMIAYERVDMNSLLPGVGISPSRIWLVDLTTSPPTTFPLFEDSQILGYGARWSGDGSRIALFDNNLPGIIVYDLTTDTYDSLLTEYGASGALSPDGAQLVYPELTFDGSRASARLMLAELDSDTLLPLTAEGEPVDDDSAVWHPSGEFLAIGRRYYDERHTPGLQVYRMDVPSGEVTPLIVDAAYTNGFMRWEPAGEQLLLQRFPQLTPAGDFNNAGVTEIWVYTLETGQLVKVAEDAYFPQWIP